MSTRQNNSLQSAMSNLGELVEWGCRELADASSSPRLDTELLLGMVAGRRRSAILGFPEEMVSTAANEHFRSVIEARRAVTIRDGTIKSLTTRTGPDSSPAISPNGRRIGYIGFDGDLQGYQVTSREYCRYPYSRSRGGI